MRVLTPAPLVGLMLALAAPLRAGDTTYSDTRAVPRGHADSDGGTSGTSEYDFSWISIFFSRDEKDDAAIGLEDDEEEPRDPDSGVAGMPSLADKPWRLGFGSQLGVLLAHDAACGGSSVWHAEALRALSGTRQLRLRAAAFGSLIGPLADYERTILVDGAPVGVQHDSLARYGLSGYPLTAEFLWTNARGMYLAAGGGALVLRERIDVQRTGSDGAAWKPLSEVRYAVRPLVSLGLGRLAARNGGRWFQGFEFRYQAAYLLPDRRSSFPGDNAEVMHSFAWGWNWLW